MLNGTSRDDAIDGREGHDIIHGAAGDDTIHGGAGDDTIYSGLGADSLWGDAGFDIFKYETFDDSNASSGVDTIKDLDMALDGDYIDITAFGQTTLLAAYDASFVGNQATLTYDGGADETTFNIYNGDPTAIFTLKMSGLFNAESPGIVGLTIKVPVPPIPSGANAFYSTAASELFEASEGKDIFIFDASGLGGDDEIRGFDPFEDEVWIMNGGFALSSWQGQNDSKIFFTDTTQQTGSVFVPAADIWNLESYDAIRLIAAGIDQYY